MKLPSSQIQAIQGAAVEPIRNDHLEAALSHAQDGWHVFPLRPGTKVPLFPRAHEKGIQCRGECGKTGHGAHDGTTDVNLVAKWWSDNPRAGIGANLGDDRVVIDIDVNHGGKRPPLAPETRVHLSGRGNGNHHLVYRYAPGSVASGIRSGSNVLGSGVDIRIGRGSYVVMPPTRHEETGKPYTVESLGVPEHTITDEEVEALWTAEGLPTPVPALTSQDAARGQGNPHGALRVVHADQATVSVLSDLLNNPPKEGGRNEWLTRVAGHYAKQYRKAEDLYEFHVRHAARSIDPPLDPHEISKIMDSIWDSEVRNHGERECTEHTGWLSGDGAQLFCQVMIREGDDTVTEFATWGDFDISTEGVTVNEIGERSWWVKLTHDGKTHDLVLDAETLGDDRRLKIWLTKFGASWDTPVNAFPKTPPSTRLLRYLQAQRPQLIRVVPTLGYQDIGFVTHDGVITTEGFHDRDSAPAIADPRLKVRNTAPFQYGFNADRETAVKTLARVMGYQDPITTSLFGAWWAATLLKPQIHTVSSLFPIFGVEAASESGKTTGFFDLMVQLNGNTRGHTAPTKPVMRDMASSHRNGVVWVDDLDSLQPYEELMRASTTNGTVAKMRSNNEEIQSSEIVSPVFISGEALGMSTQKALADRTVVVTVDSPKNRTTADGRPQWDDITELQQLHPRQDGGLSVYAGWFVVDALRWTKQVVSSVEAHRGSGRAGDKYAVLIAGARLLDSILAGEWVPEGEHYNRVRHWANEASAGQLEADNTLTQLVIPWAVQRWQMPEHLEITSNGKFSGMVNPVVVRSSADGPPQVWVSTSLLASAWKTENNGKVSARTESVGALRDQLSAVCKASNTGGTGRTMRISGKDTTVKMRLLPSEYARVVIQRAGLADQSEDQQAELNLGDDE